MADSYVVSDLLCFLTYYVKKLSIKPIKSMIHDFYTPGVVSAAKERLVGDAASLNERNTPRLAQRRANSENKTKLEIDDIFTLYSFIDENGLCNRLPRYVSNNPEQLPQLNIEKGDITLLINKMESLEAQLGSLRCNVTAIQTAIATPVITPVVNNQANLLNENHATTAKSYSSAVVVIRYQWILFILIHRLLINSYQTITSHSQTFTTTGTILNDNVNHLAPCKQHKTA